MNPLRIVLKDDYEQLFAENGIEVLELLKDRSPDLILMEIRMPRLDGWGAIERIRAKGSSVPIIIVTGYPDPSNDGRAREIGAAQCLSKPYDVSHLKRFLRQTLG